jgi:nickel-dependent lactate racemase
LKGQIVARYFVPYGKTQISFLLPDKHPVDLIAPQQFSAAEDPLDEVRYALLNPIGRQRLPVEYRNIPSKNNTKIAIAINDKTRPVPHQYLLPPLLDELKSCGFKPENITFFIANGTHPPMTQEEYSSVLPNGLIDHYRVVSHDAKDSNDLIFLGKTQRGTPIWINKRFYSADIRVVIGNIEPHQFQGFSGGVKSAAIGLAGAETVNFNHSMMTLADSRLGEFEQNPARQDVEEIGQRIGIHFALNAILNDKKEIVKVLAGDPLTVMQSGIPLANEICQVPVFRRYNLVIASPGGHPKDINVYQAQKGLAHACLVASPGANLILTAACPEGSGSQSYEDWMQGITSYEQVFERFSAQGFKVGPHKAYQIARDAMRVNLFTLSDMSEQLASALLLNPIADLQKTINASISRLDPNQPIAILPRAASTIPFVK